MKEHKDGSKGGGGGGGTMDPGGGGEGVRVLKSLLKKPGQSKAKGQKNRVVINEKMNEFFAADYIILIKEECCAEYEEECDCCCQEHEMIRLGNCKECRAELNLSFEDGEEDEMEEDEMEEEMEEDEVDEEEDEVDHHHHPQQRGRSSGQGQVQQQHHVCGGDRGAVLLQQHAPMTPAQRRQHQRETLSPPEGYKDLCLAAQARQQLDEEELMRSEEAQRVCAECDYYQRQAGECEATHPNDPAALERGEADENAREDAGKDGWRNASQDSSDGDAGNGGALQSIDQAQQTTPDVQQRYLVETITMTTVTERRIVREISEEGVGQAIDEADSTADKSIEGGENMKNGPTINEPSKNSDESSGEKEKPAELSLAFKLGNNSLKPNSAVRQLFPDPRFISPPPAPQKSNSTEIDDSELTENQKFLITADNLRLFDSTRGPGSRSDSSESDSSIKRTIERNALRRSLIKYDTGSLKKKNLRSKDLTLEERIRQLTCVDEDEDGADGRPTENNNSGVPNIQNINNNNNSLNVNGVLIGRVIGEGVHYVDDQSLGVHQLPVRTSPSGEERPKGHVVQSHTHHHHHHNSAYRKITDLFGQKKNNSNSQSSELNLPDIGLGSKHNMAVKTNSGSKLTTEARRQFLSSLAPLSCVASNSADANETYYRMPVKANNAPGDRNSVCYNSDSSYSIEDIETALSEGIPAPPDVTRGTPTSAGPSMDSFGNNEASDELMAFVEQDKSRTERIKRRYNDSEDKNSDLNNIDIPRNVVNLNNKDDDNEDDDELNDYGFNRRPSVRGIKAQFETTNEIVRQLRTRSAAANSLPEACRLNFPGAAAAVSASGQEDELAASSSSSSDIYRVTYTNEVHSDHNTINRINNMQKQINEIYQSLAESSLSAAILNEQGGKPAALGYLDGTLPRNMEGHRYIEQQKNGLQAGTLLNPARMLRAADGMAAATPGLYSTLPKTHRQPHVSAAYSASAGYSCGVLQPTGVANVGTIPGGGNAKCYKTMYFVPYNGLSDPTYQNIQKILPPHNAPANYADHLERYPYPRNGHQQQQLQPRYYVRPASVPNTQAGALHLHLHQAEEFQVSTAAGAAPSGAATLPARSQSMSHSTLVHPLHQQQVQQIQQQQQQQLESAYKVETLSGVTYSICPPPPSMSTSTSTYTYQMQIQGRLSSTDPANVVPTPQIANTLLSSANLLANSTLPVSLNSGTSSLLSSPTKTPQPALQRTSSCSVAERGVPEGAASAPSHDFVVSSSSSQANNGALLTSTTTTVVQTSDTNGAGPPPMVDAQNPVYYAMNV